MGIVYRFQEGKIRVNYNWFLGYTKDENGELVIVPEQAEVVRRIYREFLEGQSAGSIKKGLEKDGLKNGAGRTKWWDTNIYQILRNEKYMGDALLQKTYTIDFLTKKKVMNDGYVQKYYVENSHAEIVSKAEYAVVQAEFARRNALRGYSKTGKREYSSKYPFSGKIVCMNCGSKFNRGKWGTGKNMKYVWICANHRRNGVEACPQKALKERDVEKVFVRAINKLIGGKEEFLNKLMANIKNGIKKEECEVTEEQINEKLSQLQQELMQLVRVNAKTGIDTRDYSSEYEKIGEEIDKIRRLRQKLIDDKVQKIMMNKRIEEVRRFFETQ